MPKTILFTDLRNIRCGDLEWLSSEGNRFPLIKPPEPQIELYARTGIMPHGIRLIAQKANKTEPLSKGIGRVIYDGGMYRSWSLKANYQTGQNLGAYSTSDPLSISIGHAESKDGFEWSEQNYCVIEVPGQTSFDGFAFFIDPKGSPEERYKAVYTAHPPKSEWQALAEKVEKIHPRHKDWRMSVKNIYCMYGIVSPDGINWAPIPEPLMIHMSDTDTTVYYDRWLDRYVMYTRLYWHERRLVGRAEAEDFRNWGPVEPLLWPKLDWAFTDDIYTNGRTEYPNLPEYHLMFPMVYHRYNQTSEIYLFSSEDGICWNQVPGSPVISPGLPGEWDSEFIVAGKDLVPLGNDRIGIPYHGTSFPHKYPRWDGVLSAGRTAWAWWQKGRICAIVADEEGEFVTFPLVCEGRELRINARTRKAGMIKVGLLGVSGRSVDECDPIVGDNIAHPVHWKGQSDVTVKDGERVMLHFKLRNAELFTVEWV